MKTDDLLEMLSTNVEAVDCREVSRTILITVTGQQKRDLLEQAIADGQSSKLPIGRVLAEVEQPIDIHWCP